MDLKNLFCLTKIKQEEVIVGTYHLSNLLQELAELKEANPSLRRLSRIQENPYTEFQEKSGMIIGKN
jgi:hypothetical protein